VGLLTHRISLSTAAVNIACRPYGAPSQSLGVIAQVISSGAFVREFNDPGPNAKGAVVSVFTGGAFFGAALGGPAGDYLGRRLTILIGACVSIYQCSFS
jgi:MFS family permease